MGQDVKCDGWISDESSLYDDDDPESNSVDGTSYWETHHLLPSTKQYQTIARQAPLIAEDDEDLKHTIALSLKPEPVDSRAPALFNPCEGWPNARQLSESVAEFTKRLPPLSSETEDGWIWIANPFAARETEPDMCGFFKAGRKLQNDFIATKSEVTAQNPGKAPGVITRKLTPHRDKLVADLREVAIEHKVIFGKWLLYPTIDDVPRTWKQVAEAVADNRLGPVAKVATSASLGSDPTVRVICVYTKDFSDETDVRRVLDELVNMAIVQQDQPRGIPYKSDAYTYLNIYADNEYRIPASSYQSRTLLSTPTPKGKRKAADSPMEVDGTPKSKKQKTLGKFFKR